MEEKRIGVYICWCGSNIAKIVDVEKVAEDMEQLPDVVISKNYKYMCSDPGQELIINDIKEHNLNRVVVAACSPRIHEITFRKTLENAGLNPYMFQMANIREQVSWVHTDRAEATRKARSLVAAAIHRVIHHEALDKRTVEINPATLVIGAGISGITAALEIAEAGNKVYLLEKTGAPGGMAAKIHSTFPHMYHGKEMIDPLIRKMQNHPNIELLLNATIEEIFGYIGNFEANIFSADKKHELKFGNIIVTTGLKTFDPSTVKEYGYGKYKGVITSLEFESMLKEGKIETPDGRNPEHVAIVHCVGSRNNNYHEYCSRTCCQTALKYANEIRSALPETAVYDLYADMRAYGKWAEEMYATTGKRGVLFLMFDQKDGLPVIKPSSNGHPNGYHLDVRELLSGQDITVPADLVILMTGVEAQDDAKEIAHLTGISKCGNDFYIERHPKLDPVATTTDGVYIAGSCQGPKDITESVSQSRAAAARVLASIAKKLVEVEVTTAVTNEDICCGCQTCVKVCPYSAISFDEEKNVSVVNEILCKGCGTCGSACPTGAIRSRHFTDEQILSQIKGLMHMEKTI